MATRPATQPHPANRQRPGTVAMYGTPGTTRTCNRRIRVRCGDGPQPSDTPMTLAATGFAICCVSTKCARIWSAFVPGSAQEPADSTLRSRDGPVGGVASDDAQGSVVAQPGSGPGTASSLAISGSAKSRDHPNILNLLCGLFCQGAFGLGGQDWVGRHRGGGRLL